MNLDITPKVMRWLENTLKDQKPLNFIKLKGATSTTLYKVITDSETYVLRLYDNKEWLKNEPDLARHEAEALSVASPSLSIKTPRVIRVDETGDACGMPVVLMEFVPGVVDIMPAHLDSWLKELARGLAEIHQITPPSHFQWHFFRYTKSSALTIPSWTRYPELWEKGIKRVKENPPSYKEVFIHRDYHPVNVLWQDGKLTSVVDWVNACLGPAGIDIGHCRNNLVCLFGIDAADTFLKYYQTYAGNHFTYDVYWDLISYFDFVYPGPLGVYQGWLDFGLKSLSDALMNERLESYLATLIGN